MRAKYCVIFISICAFVSGAIAVFAPKALAKEELHKPPGKKILREMLEDKELPAEIKEELKGMLKEAEPEDGEDGQIDAAPAPLKIERLSGISKEGAGRGDAGASNTISLDLKGVDIIDVLKMISSRSNLNLVAGKDVRGKVTLFLKDVDIWDAFEIILAANDLAYEQKGGIINVMTERDYEALYGEKHYNKKDFRIFRLEYAKASEVSKALNQAKSKIGKVIVDESSNTMVVIDSPKVISEMEGMIAEMDIPIEIKVFSLDYAKAEDVKTKITDILTKGVGTMQVDERTNKIIVTDLSKNMPEITNVISEMDEKHKEVLIEAKIVEVSLTDEYAYGVDWKAAFQSLSDQGIRIDLDDFSGNVFGGGTMGGTLTLASVASRNLNGVIEALKTVGRTNVISSPRITVLNNEEAKVLVGTNQPYVTTTTTVPDSGSSITAESVTYIDVGVELTVTPTINKDGFVTMKIKPKVSSLGTPLETHSGNDIPVVSTSETETTIMVKDGNTIIIAGLIEDRDQVEEDKIPFLGDIPIIGPLLFGNRSVGSSSVPEKKELVVFLTPYIIKGTETFPESENVWYGNSITQRELLEKQMSMAVEDAQMRSLIKERRPREEKNMTTRISEDLAFFKKREGIDELEEKRARLSREIKPAEEKGTIPEKAATEAERQTVIPPTNLITPSVSGYYGYFENLRNRIYWVAKENSPGNMSGKIEDVEILFKLDRDGGLKGEPEILNDVDKKVASAAKTAVKKAAPFPPFPRRMDEEEATFRITITYQ